MTPLIINPRAPLAWELLCLWERSPDTSQRSARLAWVEEEYVAKHPEALRLEVARAVDEVTRETEGGWPC